MCDDHEPHAHDLGLPHDLRVLQTRRRFLTGAAGLSAAGLLAGCGEFSPFGGAEAEVVATAADGAECVGHPAETAGPYPADGSNEAHGTLANVLSDSGVLRGDIRPDIAGDATTFAPGAPLELTARLVDVGDACKPLAGYCIYLWHCDAEGRYSLYDLPERTFLRGVGVADAAGEVRFTTIVPGCYRGRYPHMHFEIYPALQAATDYRNRVLTSQLAIPAAVCDAVYQSDPVYRASIENYAHSPLDRDGIFSNNTSRQLAAQTPEIVSGSAGGYRGSVTIGVRV